MHSKITPIFILIIIILSIDNSEGFNDDDVDYYVYETSYGDHHEFKFEISDVFTDHYNNTWHNGTFYLADNSGLVRMYNNEHPWDLFNLYLDGVEFEDVGDDDIYYSMIQPVMFHNATGSHYWIQLVEERSSCDVEYDGLILTNVEEDPRSIIIANVDCSFNGFDDRFRYTVAQKMGVVINAVWEVENDNFRMEFTAQKSTYDYSVILWENNTFIEYDIEDAEITTTEQINLKISFSNYFILGIIVITIKRKLT